MEKTEKISSALGKDSQQTQNRLSYEARKDFNKSVKKLEKSVSEAESTIAKLESSLAETESRLSTAEGASDASLYTRYSNLKKELEQAMESWADLSEQLEILKTEK